MEIRASASGDGRLEPTLVGGRRCQPPTHKMEIQRLPLKRSNIGNIQFRFITEQNLILKNIYLPNYYVQRARHSERYTYIALEEASNRLSTESNRSTRITEVDCIASLRRGIMTGTGSGSFKLRRFYVARLCAEPEVGNSPSSTPTPESTWCVVQGGYGCRGGCYGLGWVGRKRFDDCTSRLARG